MKKLALKFITERGKFSKKVKVEHSSSQLKSIESYWPFSEFSAASHSLLQQMEFAQCEEKLKLT